MTDATRLALLGAGVCAVGLLLQVAAAGRPRGERWLAVLGIAPALGIAVVGLAGAGLAVTGIGGGVTRVGLASLVVVGLARLGRDRLGGAFEAPTPVATSTTRGRIVEAGLLAGLVAVSVVLFRFLTIVPLADWDGWAIWGLHAEALFVDGDTRGPVFQDGLYAAHHPEYPVLFPVLQALVAGTVGRFDVGLIHVVGAAMPLVLGLGTWALLRSVVPPWLASLTALGVGWTPALVENLRANYADAIVASFVAMGLVGLCAWLAGSGSWALGAATLFLAASALTKNEGALFAVAAVLAGLVASAPAGRRRSPVAIAGAVVLGSAVAYRVVSGRGGSSDYDLGSLADPGFLPRHVDRIGDTASALADALGGDWSAALGLTALGIAACVLARLLWPVVFVLSFVVVAIGGLMATYATATVDLDWLLGTSAERVVFGVALGPAVVAPALAWLAVERSLGAHRALPDETAPTPDGA